MSKTWKRKDNDTDVKLETSKEINDRVTKFSTSHGVLQSDLCILLTISEGRRDQKWISDFKELRDHWVKFDLWESFVTKYNLHRGFTAEYC